MADLFEETERLKLRFIQAYERLHELGKIGDDELQGVLDALDRLDELSEDELVKRLGGFKRLLASEEESGA